MPHRIAPMHTLFAPALQPHTTSQDAQPSPAYLASPGNCLCLCPHSVVCCRPRIPEAHLRPPCPHASTSSESTTSSQSEYLAMPCIVRLIPGSSGRSLSDAQYVRKSFFHCMTTSQARKLRQAPLHLAALHFLHRCRALGAALHFFRLQCN